MNFLMGVLWIFNSLNNRFQYISTDFTQNNQQLGSVTFTRQLTSLSAVEQFSPGSTPTFKVRQQNQN